MELQTPMDSIDPTKLIPMFILWAVLMGLSLFLIKSKKMSNKLGFLLLAIAFVVSGLILGAIPSPVFPIQTIFMNIGLGAPLAKILPILLILIILLTISLIFGRIFCAYACPLGAIQELVSKIQFKSTLKGAKSRKTIKINGTASRWIRLAYFIAFIGASLVWAAAVVQYLNPFIGFQVFKKPIFPIIVIPAVELAVIMISSVFIYRPWCRLFCPYGMLASLVSNKAMYKLRRNNQCTDCGLCEKICPTNEAGAASTKSECYLCNRCVEICPNHALDFNKK